MPSNAPQPANHGLHLDGPNVSVLDTHPTIGTDPMWRQPSGPVPKAWYGDGLLVPQVSHKPPPPPPKLITRTAHDSVPVTDVALDPGYPIIRTTSDSAPFTTDAATAIRSGYQMGYVNTHY